MEYVFEKQKGVPMPEGAVDGMQEFMEQIDNDHSMEWDCDHMPPIGFWGGTHTRSGRRVKGFTEAEYLQGEDCGTVLKDENGNPVYAE